MNLSWAYHAHVEKHSSFSEGRPELLMAQFTPCKEKNPHARTTHPLLVGAQADLLDNVQITVVIDNPSVGKES